MRRWALVCALLSSLTLSAQGPVPVTFAWDAIPSDGTGAFAEIERNGVVQPCGVVTRTDTDRRCTMNQPIGPAQFRMRWLTVESQAGPWTPVLEGTVGPSGTAPGRFTITWHSPISPAPEGPPSMAATLRVQDQGSGSGVTSDTATLAGVQTGDRLIVCVRERDGGAISSVTSSIDGALTQAVNRAVTAAQVAIFSLPNASAGTHTITVLFGANRTFDFTAQAWGGMATTGGADVTASAGNSGVTSHNHGSVTPSASALLITCLGTGNDHGGATAPAGFTLLTVDAGATANRQVYAYKVGHTGALNPAAGTTNSVNSDGAVAAFLEATGGGASILRQMLQQHY